MIHVKSETIHRCLNEDVTEAGNERIWTCENMFQFLGSMILKECAYVFEVVLLETCTGVPRMDGEGVRKP